MPSLSSQKNSEERSASAELRLNLGRVYALAGRPERAREQFEHGLQLDPRHRALREALRETASLLP